MKTTNKTLLQCAALGLAFSAVYALAGQPAQAQAAQQDSRLGPQRLPMPGVQKRADESAVLARTAAADLHAGRYAEAEAEAREAVAIEVLPGIGEEILAAALEAQGKDQEALQAYQTVVEQADRQPRNLLPYAGLLLESGQWAEALTVYNQALPRLPDVGPHLEATIVHDGDVIRANSHFSPDVPEPMALATAIHIARGMVYNNTPSWAYTSQDTEAMAEYTKALQLAPDNALTNYFYGVGWQRLSPAERAKFGTAQQAKAHLEKAVKVGDASVKTAARKALKAMG